MPSKHIIFKRGLISFFKIPPPYQVFKKWVNIFFWNNAIEFLIQNKMFLCWNVTILD